MNKSNIKRPTHELVASAIATKIAHEVDPENKVGCMLAAGPTIRTLVNLKMFGLQDRQIMRKLFLYRCPVTRRISGIRLKKMERDGIDQYGHPKMSHF